VHAVLRVDDKVRIAKLDDEHLLDLHDIFRSDAGSPLDDMASAEMRKRNLQPETNG
jgi:hypothetical protein